jgi:hypothetical protein
VGTGVSVGNGKRVGVGISVEFMHDETASPKRIVDTYRKR